MATRKPGNDDDDANELDIVERINDEGEEVFSLEWDSGGPGAGAGCESVYRWKDKFAASSLDDCIPGPFATLEEALEANEYLMVTSATTSISCTLLTARELAKRLQCDENGHAITINGEVWVYRKKGGFQKKRQH